MVIFENPGAGVGMVVVPFPHVEVDGICNVTFFPLKIQVQIIIYLFPEKKLSIHYVHARQILAATKKGTYKIGILVSGLLMTLILNLAQ